MVKKKSVKKSSKRVFKKTKFNQEKFNLVTKKLIFFFIGFITSFVLYKVSNNEMLMDIFGLLAIVLGFISMAFLIIFLIFLFMKFIKK
jgi:hypothetical protein